MYEKARAKEKSEAEMIAQIMTQIPTEYKVVMQVIRIMPVANQTLKLEQQIYVDLGNAKYK